MIPPIETILQIIEDDQIAKGIQTYWENHKPIGVAGQEWIISISNDGTNGRDGMGYIYSFQADFFEEALISYNDLSNEVTGENPNLTADRFAHIDKTREVYLKVKFTRWD